jgi:carbon starvation protein
MLQKGIGFPKWFALALMGVLVASFAGTTMDTATRLQRYVITELASEVNLPSLTNRYVATSVATVSALALALCDALWDGLADSGKGALTLWPLFASVNQLLAALTLLVLSFWLYRNRKPFLLTAIPMVLMFVVTGWAMVDEIRTYWSKVINQDLKNLQLLVIGALVLVLEAWMIFEALGVVRTLRAGRTAAVADQADAE